MAETTIPFPGLPAEPLWREVVGDRLRRLRLERGETLTEVASRAGISPQYLSEIERGLKEPSSEMIAAVSGALGASLLDLTTGVVGDLMPVERDYAGARPTGDPRGTAGTVLTLVS